MKVNASLRNQSRRIFYRAVRHSGFIIILSAKQSDSFAMLKTKIQVKKMQRNNPNVVISSADADKLRRLLDSISENTFPGKDELEEELARAEIVEPDQIPEHVVTMNSTVHFEILPSGKEFMLKLVFPGETSGMSDSISIFAPVGGALLGLSVGDTIEWPIPGRGNIRVHIKAVISQPEREELS